MHQEVTTGRACFCVWCGRARERERERERERQRESERERERERPPKPAITLVQRPDLNTTVSLGPNSEQT